MTTHGDGPTPDVQRYGCATCRTPLNTFESPGNPVVFLHPGNTTANHDPDPVPLSQLPTVEAVCDFCSAPNPVASFAFSSLEIVTVDEDDSPTMTHDLGGNWAACEGCARLVATRDVAGLTARAARRARRRGIPATAATFGPLHQALFAATPLTPPRLPLRGTAAQPSTTPDVRSIRPQALPKVRDRLVRFWRNAGEAFVLESLNIGAGYSVPGHMIPGAPLHASVIRDLTGELINQYTALMSNHVENGRLFWVDSEFTALAAHAARDLPDIRVQPAELPTSDGLLVWQDPIAWLNDHEAGTTMPVTAVSWGPIPGGVWVVFYTPAETVLTESGQITEQRFQRLRDRIGWFAPVHTGTALVYGENHDAESDDSRKLLTALIATWILTTQPDAEITEKPADKATRKAYKRTKRPAPVVRLVSLRRKQQTRTEETTTGKTRTYTRRWWVAGFFREQPYGPGRALRRRTYVRPHIKGPADAPLILTDQVNILGRNTDQHPRENR
ncbi:hypothetical protein QTQ03_28495 [Micromonospora sp. WMMA1363]|uniref:hypothetical protein n=1 Tax=Micromonospora sp. WMMA1363 TaxID=3053985 RepID=UPI00259D2F44|nr:hypothetical protein [Micromonospora sp. WMMA1363]MDM4723347.1 hypothetical protein [Micromonospora sp. WMMA1363]